MRNAPDDFQSRLKREFDGRLRIRWSTGKGEWHIEHKVGRAVVPPSPVDETDDEHIRARDGYMFVMAIREGDRMPCPGCGTELRVPILKTAEVKCTYCKLSGKDGRYPAAYYPLEGDMLIERLREIDPFRGRGKVIAGMMDQRNKAIMQSRERELTNTIEASTKDNWNRIAGIPSVGYTGREHK